VPFPNTSRVPVQTAVLFVGAATSICCSERLPRVRGESQMTEQGLTSEELAKLIRRLDALIDEARTLQAQIAERLQADRRRVQPDRTGEPERRHRRRTVRV
jgi:hypothetical protein